MSDASSDRTFVGAIATFALACCFACSADRSQWQIYEENDALGGDSDQHYTQGLRVVSLSRPEDASAWLKGTAEFLRPARIQLGGTSGSPGQTTSAGETVNNVGWFIAQNQYTPEDITRSERILDDRPYAGWLQFGIIDRATKFDADKDKRHDEVAQIDLSLGVTGPPSLAEQAQTLWHEIWDFTEPQGWDNQIEFEPVIQANWGYARRLIYQGLGSRYGFDFAGSADGSLGTALIGLGVGTTARVGWNLMRDFAPAVQEPSPFQNIRGSLSPTTLEDDTWWSGSANWSIYGFTGAYGRAVGRNMFLDDGLRESAHSVEHEDFVGELRAGASASYGPYFLTYAFVIRTREFEEQDSDHHRFGALSLGLNWMF